MSAAIDQTPVLPRIRSSGADALIRRGRPVVLRPGTLPQALLAEVKVRHEDLLTELQAEADIDAAAIAEERAAIIAEGEHGAPLATVPHEMPVSWADASIEPTAGARCRNCGGKTWWCEAMAPRGWRCGACHPGLHLPSARRRDVRT